MIYDVIVQDFGADVVCLQELWFEEDFLAQFEARVAEKYTMHKAQRRRGKPDGMILDNLTEYLACMT